MLDRFNYRLVFAALLIGAGILFLLQNLGFLGNLTDLVWALMFVIGGAAFLSVLLGGRKNWWAAIPGIILISIGVIIAMDALFPALSGRFGGMVILGGIGLAFVLVYLLAPENWWAIIPAGVMLSLALVTVADSIPGIDGGGLLLIGMGVTFAVLGLINVKGRKLSWPWIPAIVLFVIGLLVVSLSGNMASIFWPVALILLGGFLIFRNYLGHRSAS